jgi:uncharacterized coiled-coil DUF342 family protein
MQMKMSTRPELNIDGFFDNVLSTYETRIQKIQDAFQSSENLTESSNSLFDNIHNSLNNLRKERDLMNSKLCEAVAKNVSLRKKDYNTMMSGILNTLDEKEKNAENQFLIFIETQKETARSLKNSLLTIKDITAKDAKEKIALVKAQISQISEQQELRKEAVMKTFIEFQQLHNKMMECFEDLLKKGDHILVQDIKSIKELVFQKIHATKPACTGVN